MSIIDVLKELAEAIAGAFVEVAQALGGIFFTATTENTAGFTVTPLGYVALIGLVMGIVVLVFNWVTRLVKAKR